jgi:hypothetical protein
MVVFATWPEEATSKTKIVASANHFDDDTTSIDTTSDHCQSSKDDESQDELDEVKDTNYDSWKTNSFWYDAVVDEVVCSTCSEADSINEVVNTSVTPMLPTLVTVPIVVDVLAPTAENASHLLKHAEELKRMAAQLEAEAGKLMNSALDFPEEHSDVQDTTALSESQASDVKTTVMIRNIPNNVTRADLLDRLASHGFQFSFDFVYLPIDIKRDANLGYAFVNFLTNEVADRFYVSFNGFRNWGFASNKVSEVSWGSLHGLDAHIERYRNSPVMHKDVPDEHRPVLFNEGQRVPFPAPTKRIRAPRMK